MCLVCGMFVSHEFPEWTKPTGKEPPADPLRDSQKLCWASVRFTTWSSACPFCCRKVLNYRAFGKDS